MLDDGREGLALGTVPSVAASGAGPGIFSEMPPDPGQVVSFSATPLDERELAQLDAYARQGGGDGKWSAFLCRFESGRADRVAVRVARDADEGRLLGFLSLIWPVLREDCLRNLAEQRTATADEAMHWLIAKKMNLAVFVMNAEGIMLRRNTAAKILLEQGHVLKCTRHGIACCTEAQTRMLREAIARCSEAEPEDADTVVFLSSDSPDQASHCAGVPVTLSRFFHDGAPTSLVTMMLPSPPDSRRVEIVAREMGLTQSEARVAALMQLGLSNREAAPLAGLTEQSLCTYAKRVLSKLNAASRAEVAQMLTWQAQGGPVS